MENEAILPIGSHSRIVFCDNMDGQSGVPALEDLSVALTFTSSTTIFYVDRKRRPVIKFNHAIEVGGNGGHSRPPPISHHCPVMIADCETP